MSRRSIQLLFLALLLPAACGGESGGRSPADATGGTGGRDAGGSPVADGGGGTAGAGTGGAGGGAGGAGAGGADGGSAGGAGGGSGGGVGGGAGGALDPRCQVAWADVQAGTAADDQIRGMTVDADRNIFVSGYERGVVGVTNIEPDGDSRAVVVKYGPAGTMTWKAVLDTPATDTAEDVAIDPATGNLVVLGRTSGAFPTFVNQGQFDLVLAQLDPDGQPLTVFQSGNERPQHPARLSVGPGGNIVVAGWDDTYIPTNFVAANQDGFIGAFGIGPGPAVAPTSPLQYLATPSASAPFTFATGVAAERDGSGESYVTFVASTSTRNAHGIFLTKLRADLSVVWLVNLSGFPFDAVNAVALSPSGELFVTGGTFLTLGRRSFGQEDAFLMKIDKETGSPLWAAQAGGADSDFPTALAFDPAGNVYISGITLGSVAGGMPNRGDIDIFAMKFAPTGDLVSVWQTGTPVDDEATSLAVDHCGNVLVGGYTAGALVAGHPSAGGEDMFIVRADLRAVPAGGDDRAQPPSCIGLPAMCGPAGDDSCCRSPEIAGGTYYRSHDLGGDDASGNTSYPATVGDLRLDRYEVTVGRFRKFVNAGMGTQGRPPAAGAGAHARIAGSGWDPSWNANLAAGMPALLAALKCEPTLQTWTDAPAGNEQRPMNCITWYEAMAFCAWDGGYLPTEAEWNYAAAGGDQQRAYPWSTPAGSLILDASHASYYDGTDCVGDGLADCALTDLTAAGSKPAGDGRWGQSDLAGNVLEWTLDSAAPYLTPCADCANLAPAVHREVRGGSFASNADDVRAGSRLGLAPTARNEITGVRCARAQ